MRLERLLLALALLLPVAPAAYAGGMGHGGGFGGPTGFAVIRPAGRPGSAPAPVVSGWHRGPPRVGSFAWRSGHWWHGAHGRRLGWWWIAGPAWFWYGAGLYPYAGFYAEPYPAAGYLYWCDFFQNYWPNVADCPSGWQIVAQ
jgi:hypothetical protein